MARSIQARYYEQLDHDPSGRAMGFMDPWVHTAWRTREEFHGLAVQAAACLRDRGLGRGDVCVVVLPSNELAATALTGALLLGAIPLLVAPPVLQGAHSSLGEILAGTIRRTRARVVLCDESLAGMEERLREAAPEAAFLFGGAEVHAARAGDVPRVVPPGDAVAAYQLTSGTTGFPRVCVWKQERVLAALDGMVAAMKLTPADVCFNWTPLYHDMGLVNNFLTCFTSGVPLVFLSPQEFVKKPALWLQGLHATGATVTWSPNFGFALCAQLAREKDLEGVRLDAVKAFWNAAERIHHETMVAFEERFRPYGLRRDALKTNFGCAENVGGATFSDPDGGYCHETVDLAKLQDERVAVVVPPGQPGETMTLVSAGRPYPGMEVCVLSEDGEALPEGHVGALALRTPSRMVGYLEDPEATAEAFHGEWLRTGDLAYLRGPEVYWAGRVKERITIRGKKLDPSDFEPILFRIDGLRPGCFVAFGVDDPELGTQRVVVVSEVHDRNVRSAKELRRQVKAAVNLGLGIEVSDAVLVKKGTLTKTSSGKRRHRHFRELYQKDRLQEFLYQDTPG